MAFVLVIFVEERRVDVSLVRRTRANSVVVVVVPIPVRARAGAESERVMRPELVLFHQPLLHQRRRRVRVGVVVAQRIDLAVRAIRVVPERLRPGDAAPGADAVRGPIDPEPVHAVPAGEGIAAEEVAVAVRVSRCLEAARLLRPRAPGCGVEADEYGCEKNGAGLGEHAGVG